jgi:hypothetical protein
MRFFAVTVLAVLLITRGSRADTILFDSGGFEAYNIAALNGQFGWVRDSTGNFQVQSVVTNGGTRAASVTGGVTDWAYPVLNYTPSAGEVIRIEADIARTRAATTPSFGYSIDIYTPGGASRIFRFGLADNGAGGIVPYVSSLFDSTSSTFSPTGVASNVSVGGVVSDNTFQSFRADLNFTTKRVDLFVNGTSVTGSANIPFLDLTAAVLGDADFQVSSNATATDIGYLDNYRVTAISAVPEPSTLLLATLPAAVLALRRRMKRFGF